MKHYVAVEDHTQKELQELIDLSMQMKQGSKTVSLKGKTLVSMFFNPSTRTKTSFDLAMEQLGGHNICLEPGSSSWGIEMEEGAVMDGDKEEHLKDATKVLCKYGDAIAVRCFPPFMDWEHEKTDPIMKSMVNWSNNPIINMETITHPCQALAMMQTLQEKMGSVKGKKLLLTWAYHPKPLNTAVANSAGVIASMFGMDVTVANPVGYDLDPYYTDIMKKNCEAAGATFEQSHDQDEAAEEADIVYAKSWGSIQQYGAFQKDVHDSNKDWIVDSSLMEKTNDALFSHCLPVRRNMIVSDEVIDSESSLVYEEAENRLHVQKAILAKLMGGV